MGMWTAPSDQDYASEMMQDLDDLDRVCPNCGCEDSDCHCWDEDDEDDERFDLDRDDA